jgi:hypothetical protein
LLSHATLAYFAARLLTTIPGAPHVLRFIRQRAAIPYLCWGVTLLSIIALNHVFLDSINLWILVTTPVSPRTLGNPIIGYSSLLAGSPIHIENLSPLYQSLTFNGVFAPPTGFFLRAVYPFLVSLGSWVIELRAAALAINYISLAIVLASTFWLARRLSHSYGAALFATGLAAIGTGSILHLNDLSAHMLGFAVYAAVTCVALKSRVWESRQPFRVHIKLGVMLAIATVAYPSGFLLTMCYVLVAVRISNPLHVVTAATLGGVSRLGWENLMSGAYQVFFDFVPPDISDFADHTRRAVDFWLDLLLHDPLHFLATAAQALLDCIFVAFPAITLAGVAAVILLNWRSRARLWFFAVFFALPYFGVAFFSPVAGARGYLAYCSAFIIFASLPALVFSCFGGFRTAAYIRSGVCATLLIAQGLWSVAPYLGYYFPAFAYYIGLSNGIDAFTRIDVINFAGDAPLWRYFGGPAGFLDAGGLPLGAIDHAGNADRRSFGFSLCCNGFMLGLAVALHASWTMCRRLSAEPTGETRLANPATLPLWCWPATWLALSAAISGAGYMFQTQELRPFSPRHITQFPGRQSLNLGVRVSPETSRRILDALRTGARLESYLTFYGTGVIGATFRIGAHELAAQRVDTQFDETVFWRLDNSVLASALNPEGAWLSSEISLDRGSVGGWQAATPSRTVSPTLRALELPYWPSLELRLFDPEKHTTVFIGY